MPEITFYRAIYVLSLLVGIAVPIVTAVRIALILAAMKGLIGDQQLQHERYLRDLDKTEQKQEQQTGPPVVQHRDLTLPALPDEGY